MNVVPETPSDVVARPPSLIQAMINGFNAVATHVYLIALPVALDLLLWFGPHLRVNRLFAPNLQDMLNLIQSSASADMRPVLDNMGTLWKTFLEQFNLISAISTFPVGVPSLLVGLMPVHTPLGAPLLIEIPSTGDFLLSWLLISLVGILLGSLYFSGIARVTVREVSAVENCQPAANLPALNLGTLGWQTLQVLTMIVILLILVLVIMVPTVLVSLLISLLSPFIAQMVLLLVSFGVVWLMVPLIFSPLGIFMCGQTALNAMFNSARVVRFILPGTALFLLVAILINQGLGMLWTIPPDTSWMALVGIVGHAFIITGLLAASFVYYRGGLNYFQALRKLAMNRQ